MASKVFWFKSAPLEASLSCNPAQAVVHVCVQCLTFGGTGVCHAQVAICCQQSPCVCLCVRMLCVCFRYTQHMLAQTYARRLVSVMRKVHSAVNYRAEDAIHKIIWKASFHCSRHASSRYSRAVVSFLQALHCVTPQSASVTLQKTTENLHGLSEFFLFYCVFYFILKLCLNSPAFDPHVLMRITYDHCLACHSHCVSNKQCTFNLVQVRTMHMLCEQHMSSIRTPIFPAGAIHVRRPVGKLHVTMCNKCTLHENTRHVQ